MKSVNLRDAALAELRSLGITAELCAALDLESIEAGAERVVIHLGFDRARGRGVHSLNLDRSAVPRTLEWLARRTTQAALGFARDPHALFIALYAGNGGRLTAQGIRSCLFRERRRKLRNFRKGRRS